jgi:diacylglycerol kinase (ATP)
MEGLAGYIGDVLVVANPISGGGKAGRWADGVAIALKGMGLTPHVVKTGGPGEGRRAAQEFRHGLILAFGGDGTFNEVLNGCDLDSCILGLLPAGTGNVLGKELGLLGTPFESLGLLSQGRILRFDLGVCNGRRFISVFGAGLDAQIVSDIHKNRKGRLSQLNYVPLVLREVIRPRRWEICAEADGRVFVRGASFVCIGNTHTYGGPLEMTPLASPVDGALDAMAIRARSVMDYVALCVPVHLGGLHMTQNARYGRGATFRVTSLCGEALWEVDGDVGGTLPAEVRCEAGRVRLLVPPGYRTHRPV